MSVKRYAAHTNIDDFKSDWHESKDGPMVKHQDYAALEARCAALAAENAGLKAAIPPLKIINDVTDSWDDVSLAEEIGFNYAVSTILKSLPETPATDAFLAEVRAQGVEMFAKYIALYNSNSEHHAQSFAAQIRKGVQQ